MGLHLLARVNCAAMSDFQTWLQGQASGFWAQVRLFWRTELWPKIKYVLLHLAEAVVEVIPESIQLFFTAIELVGPITGIFVASALGIIIALVIFFGLDLVYGLLKALVYFINKALKVAGSVGKFGAGLVNSVDHAFGGHSHIHVHTPTLNPCHLIPGICDVLNLHHFCRPYESAWGEFGLFFHITLSRFTCPLWRWTYFTRNDAVSLYSDVAPAVIGFTSYDPDPWGNNCEPTKFATACFWILLGFFFLALFYLAIIAIAVSGYRHTIMNILRVGVMTAYWVVVAIVELFLDAVTWTTAAFAREEAKRQPKQLPWADRLFLRHIKHTAMRQMG